MSITERKIKPEQWSVWINSFWITLFSIISNYLSGVFLSRLLKPQYFGFFYTLDSLLIILSVPFSLSSYYVFVRLIPKYIQNRDFSHIKGLIIYTLKLSFKLLIFFYCLWVIGYLGNTEFNLKFDTLRNHPIFWGVLLLPLYSIVAFLQGFFTAKKYSNLMSYLFNGVIPILDIITFLLLSFYWATFSYRLVIFGLGLSNFFFIIILLVLLFFVSQKKLWQSQPVYSIKIWNLECLEFTKLGVMDAILFFCPLIIISTCKFRFSPEDISVFAMFSVILNIINFLPVSSTSEVIAEFISTSKQSHQLILDRGLQIATGAAIILGGLGLIFRNQILYSFGGHYMQHATDYYVVFIILLMISAPLAICQNFASYTSLASSLVKRLPIFLLCIIVLSYLGIYFYGMWGGVLTFALVNIPYQLYSAYLLKTKYALKLTNFLKIF